MYDQIIKDARQAALEAFHNAKPVPMIVGQAIGFTNQIVPGTEEFVVDGVCGFAWVRIKPARGPLIKYLKDNGIGEKAWNGGWTISSYEIEREIGFSQS